MHVTVSQLLQTAFAMANGSYPSLADQWTAASYRVDSAMIGTMVFAKVQDLGRIDVLSRALEDDERERLASGQADLHATNNLALLSAAFIGGMYAVVRALRDREQRKMQGNIARVFPAPDLDRLLHDLELVRVPLEKFELQQERKLEGPLQMFAVPYVDGNDDVSTYDRADPHRALILPTASAL
ncbi:hypothetical protein [Bradyrhizobium sp. WSM2254]|uniref:hypothetical protein n=1 Tax=Bradyrhizobium sp. WSM2254 TaxID=1188263 RepID=UPI000480C5CC|nr:hypothetical protein [Bradyrhizobium sp. WSM2254]